MMLELRRIKNETDYRAALVEAYEQRYYPIEVLSPIEAILYYIESRFARYNTSKSSWKVEKMQRFSVKKIQNTHNDVLNQAAVEPVLLTDESQPSYVIMSVENYEQLINRLALLEDLIIGQQAQTALSNSRMVGTETFTAELKRLAGLDDTTL
jgi:PHD/YefM family antitoxin component YafN of YafNO toxin-antitoxin module